MDLGCGEESLGSFGWSIPIEEIEEILEVVPPCICCEEAFVDEAIYDVNGEYYCKACFAEMVRELQPEALAFATEQCKFISDDLPIFDPLEEYRPTREEYEAGEKYANTENSFRCQLRHEYTNYDSLIAGLDRDVFYDQIIYAAIRARIMELVDEAIVQRDLIRYEREDD